MRRLLIVLIAAALLALAAPANATNDEIGLSADGHTFTSSLPALFEPDLRIIPGVEVTRSFYVRNQSSERAYLQVDTGEASGPLVELGELTATASSAGSTATTITLAPHTRLLEGGLLDPGQVVKIDITLALPADSENPSQSLAGRLGFSVRLSQSEAVLAPSGPQPSGPQQGGESKGAVAGHPGILPSTGSAVSQKLVLFAASMIGIGLALLRRRHEEGTSDNA